MINWDFFQPRNLAVIAACSLIAYMIYNHFSKPPKSEAQ